MKRHETSWNQGGTSMASSYWLPAVRQSCTAFAAEDRYCEVSRCRFHWTWPDTPFFLHVNHVTCAQRSETCLFMFVPCLSKWYPEKVAGGHACSECDRRMCWRRSQKVRKLLPSSRLCIGWLVEWTFVEHIPHEYSGDRDMSSWLLFLNWAIYRLPEQRGIYMYLRHL